MTPSRSASGSAIEPASVAVSVPLIIVVHGAADVTGTQPNLM